MSGVCAQGSFTCFEGVALCQPNQPLETAPGYGEPYFRAYDKATGAVVAELALPAGTTGAPMTYMHRGKQYIVVAVGGLTAPPELVALTLP